MMRDDPYTSMVLVPTATVGNGPLANQTEGYWFDMRDLLLYGEQFTNFALGASDGGIAMPQADGQKRYPTLAMADALFSGENKQILEDGICNLTILGTQKDTTPSPAPIGI